MHAQLTRIRPSRSGDFTDGREEVRARTIRAAHIASRPMLVTAHNADRRGRVRRDRLPRSLGRVASLGVSLLLLIAVLAPMPRGAAAKPRPRITDDLSDVVDDEEDEAFAAWGRPKERHVEDELDPSGDIDIAKLMKKQASGPQLTFARLFPDPAGKRTLDDVNELGAKWATLLRTGGMSEKVYGIDENTVLLSLADGAYMKEVREFLWLQEEVEEFEWNSQVWRRGSDEPQRPKSPPTQAMADDLGQAKKKGNKKKKKGSKKKGARAKKPHVEEL